MDISPVKEGINDLKKPGGLDPSMALPVGVKSGLDTHHNSTTSDIFYHVGGNSSRRDDTDFD